MEKYEAIVDKTFRPPKDSQLERCEAIVDKTFGEKLKNKFMEPYAEALRTIIHAYVMNDASILNAPDVPHTLRMKADVWDHVLKYIRQVGWEAKYNEVYRAHQQNRLEERILQDARRRIAETPEYTRRVQSTMNRLRYPTK